MRTKVIRNYFDDYSSLDKYDRIFKEELEEWNEFNLTQDLHYTVLTEIYLTEEKYILEYQFFLQGRYKYNLNYTEIKEHSLKESKQIPVKVFVNINLFREILLEYFAENINNYTDKNKIVVNGVTFKLYIQ